MSERTHAVHNSRELDTVERESKNLGTAVFVQIDFSKIKHNYWQIIAKRNKHELRANEHCANNAVNVMKSQRKKFIKNVGNKAKFKCRLYSFLHSKHLFFDDDEDQQ